jgi:signal transduction histidine kinase
MGRFRYRQLLLFLAALILPSIAIVTLGWKIIAQQRELDEKRLAEAEKRMVADVRQSLISRLNQIKLQELTATPAAPTPRAGNYSDPAVMVVGWVDRDRLVLPWDVDPNADRFRRAVAEPEFARLIDDAERVEVAEKDYGRAAILYRNAWKSARNPDQDAYARFLLARTLARTERDPAWSIYRELLNLPSSIVDDQGIPFAFYAAERLSGGDAGAAEILDRIVKDVDAFSQLSPITAYLLKDILGSLQKLNNPDIRARLAVARERLSAQLDVIEKALALQTDFHSLSITPADWQMFGEKNWLVGMTSSGSNRLVIAVKSDDVFRQIESDRASQGLATRFQILAGGDSGEALGENLPGLRLVLQLNNRIEAGGGNLQRWFYVLSLTLVIGLTVLGGYLLWRDMRRELRVAELRSQFVSSVSHELKTPLTSIRMFAETLQIRRNANPRLHEEYLETIVSESERLTRLLNNVLDFSRIERGQKTYHMQPTRLTEVIQDVVRTMQYPLSEQGFNLNVDIRDGMPELAADRDALEQAILNLLTNAIKYSGENRDIELRLCSQNGSALIQVADRGIGIPAKEQGRIFEKFYRAAVPENRVISGTGLGLALVAHVAKAHGGAVEVESKIGEGSIFSIRLPLSAGGAA